jgi:ribosome biogenesis GTPase / thiamine phosphate phosphatase
LNDHYRLLASLGWNDLFQSSFTEITSDDLDSQNSGTLLPGRVIGQGKGHYHLQIAPQEILEAAITTKFHDAVSDSTGFPTVGDWVTFRRGNGTRQATIHHLLKRQSLIQRRRAGTQQDMQLIAANVDFMLIVTSLNKDFDLQRLERYVALGTDSGSTVAVLLSKADLCSDPGEYIEKVEAKFKGLEVFAISIGELQSMNPSIDPTINPLAKFFAPGKTAVLVGSSGAGKSTLTNFLLGSDSQKTQTLGADSRGRHTTTARHLRFTRFGGLVIDTPGMQEVSAVDQQDDLETTFSDIEESMLRCKFTNCQHKSEPGCAILDSLKTGKLSPTHWENYLAAKAKASRPHKKRPR